MTKNGENYHFWEFGALPLGYFRTNRESALFFQGKKWKIVNNFPTFLWKVSNFSEMGEIAGRSSFGRGGSEFEANGRSILGGLPMAAVVSQVIQSRNVPAPPFSALVTLSTTKRSVSHSRLCLSILRFHLGNLCLFQRFFFFEMYSVFSLPQGPFSVGFTFIYWKGLILCLCCCLFWKI